MHVCACVCVHVFACVCVHVCVCVCVCTGTNDVESPSDCCFAAGEREVICNVTIVTDAFGKSDDMFTIRLDPDPGQSIYETPRGPNITVTVSKNPPPGMS